MYKCLAHTWRVSLNVVNFILHSFIFLKGSKSWDTMVGGAKRTNCLAWVLAGGAGEGVLARYLSRKLPEESPDSTSLFGFWLLFSE